MTRATQTSRILAVLGDGAWHTVADIHRRAGYSRLNSRISDLRKRGHVIACESVPGHSGAKGYRYRWEDAPAVDDGNVLSMDEHAPRRPEERFRIYRLRAGALLELLATTPTIEGVASALCRLMAEGEFDGAVPGVLDSKGQEHLSGEWLANPWAIEKEGRV